MAAGVSDRSLVKLRMAAIDYLNPAPLMWDFEHPPEAARLGGRYVIERMTPARCARALAEDEADLGLIPIGAYAATPGLLVLPGSAIASLGSIRSLLLVLRGEGRAGEEPDLDAPSQTELDRIGTVALDRSSRTTAVYTQILFRRFWKRAPVFLDRLPDLDAMLAEADAAVLIGDPALLALRDRDARLARTGERLRYVDLGQMWREATGTAWVSAFWAVRADSWARLSRGERDRLRADLARSREAGARHLPELVREWAPRLGLREAVVDAYLRHNIHYILDEEAVEGVDRFFREGAALGLFPSLPRIEWAR